MSDHKLSTYRTTLGRSAVFSRPLYGAGGRCSCGAMFRVNQAPSKGGTAKVRSLWREHLKRESEAAGD